jgi:ABC-type sulfate transport system substrate-binding protein
VVDSCHISSSSLLAASDQVQGVGYFKSEVETDAAALKLEIDVVALEMETDTAALELKTNAAPLDWETNVANLDLGMETYVS